MKTAFGHYLGLAAAFLAFAASGHAQISSTAYSNVTNNNGSALEPGGASATGGSTVLIADDLTYDKSFSGQSLSAFQVIVTTFSSTTLGCTPTVIFWDSDGASGAPGTYLGSYTLPLVSLTGFANHTLSYTVPPPQQFVLPGNGSANHTIWAGLYFTGTSTETADQINTLAIAAMNPPTIGTSQDQEFVSASPAPAAASNPSGMVYHMRFEGQPVSNYAWSLTATSPGSLDLVYDFAGDGDEPNGGLLLAGDGNFYGVTVSAGANNNGTVYQLSSTGSFHALYSFPAGASSLPTGELIEDVQGQLYGVTQQGGDNGTGSIFRVGTDGTVQTFHSFAATSNGETNSEGFTPAGALIQGRDGNFYGVTRSGGPNARGEAFRITPTGIFTPLAAFTDNIDNPVGPLIQDADGNLVGLAANGGANNAGAIYQLTLGGNLTLLDSLPADFAQPIGALTLGTDGNYYGVTGDRAFLVAPGSNGASTTLAVFGTTTAEFDPDGGLLQASDGNFYGTLLQDGNNGIGSLFRLTPGTGGTIDFEELFGVFEGSRGGFPNAPLIQAADGNLYGTAFVDGSDVGTVFRQTAAFPPVVQFHQAEYSVNEADGTAYLRVDRIGGTDALTVNYVTEDGQPAPYPTDINANAGADYRSTGGTLSWPAGDNQAFYIQVPIIDNHVSDGALVTLTLELNSPNGSNALGARSTATLTINRTEPPGLHQRGLGEWQMSAWRFTYQITATNHPSLYGASGLPAGLSLNTSTGKISGTPTAAGSFTPTLTATNAVATAQTTLDLDIANLPALHFGASSYPVNESAGSITIHVLRSGSSSGAVSVVCGTSSGTAKPGTDYTGLSQTLSWADGDTAQKSFKITIKDLGLDDGSMRSFSVKLSSPTGGAILGTPPTATINITEGDSTGSLAFAAASYTVNEDAGTLTVSVTRMGGVGGAATVVCGTSAGTAQSGTDYTGVSKTLSWAAGDGAAKTLTVSIKDLGITDGSTRQFSLKLSAATGASLGTPATATVTIQRNDPPPTLSLAVASEDVNERVGSVTFFVNRSGTTTRAVGVTCQTVAGTAKSGTDYTGLSQTLSWASGDGSARSFVVALKDLGITDGSTRAFSIKLSNPTGGAVLGSPATIAITIHENDPVQGELRFVSSSYSVDETVGTVTLHVERTVGTTGTVTVKCATSSGTAKSGIDYTGVSQTLSWVSGDKSEKSFVVKIINRGASGGGVAFSAILSAPTGGAVLVSPATAAISIDATH